MAAWPQGDVVVTFFLVVADQARARAFYEGILGGEVLRDGDPLILKLFNAVLIANDGGPPTEDKPGVWLRPPDDPSSTSAFLNLRVADVHALHRDWSALGAEWLTPPIDRGGEIRGFVRDPDGHLIEVGQSTGG